MLERQDAFDGDRQIIQADLDRALMAAFCRALDTPGAKPMDVMMAMAAAFGAIYRQVADAHQAQPCPCDWQPASLSDIDTLKLAFEAAAAPQSIQRLLTMQALGRA